MPRLRGSKKDGHPEDKVLILTNKFFAKQVLYDALYFVRSRSNSSFDTKFCCDLATCSLQNSCWSSVKNQQRNDKNDTI